MQAEGEHGKKAGTPCAWIAAKLWGNSLGVGLACGEAVCIAHGDALHMAASRECRTTSNPRLSLRDGRRRRMFPLHDGNCCSPCHGEASASISRRKPALERPARRRDAAFGRAGGPECRPATAARGGRGRIRNGSKTPPSEVFLRCSTRDGGGKSTRGWNFPRLRITFASHPAPSSSHCRALLWRSLCRRTALACSGLAPPACACVRLWRWTCRPAGAQLSSASAVRNGEGCRESGLRSAVCVCGEAA